MNIANFYQSLKKHNLIRTNFDTIFIFAKMNTLNDDCQLLILNYLNLKDQLSLFEATKEEPTNRVNLNLRYTWQHKQRYCLDAGHFNYFNKELEVLDDFLCSICPTVQQLKLQFVTLDNLKRFTPYNFSKVTSVEYTLDDDEPECNADLFIKLIAQLFPGLTNVKPYGDFNCIHLANLIDLRKLDMSESDFPTDRYKFDEIGKLKVLEELIIPSQVEIGLFNEIMRFPKLRTLTYHIDCEQSGFLSGMRVKDIERITFNDSIWWFRLPELQCLINLRQLALLEDDGFTSEELQELITALPQLERLDLVNCQFWKLETELWETVACCPSLKILNITSMPLYADFYHTSNRRPMESVLERRSIPLTLHCPDTGEYELLINFYFKHPNLNLSFEPLKISYIPCNSVEVHFLPFGISTNKEEAC